MLTTVFVTVIAMLVFCAALALGQFFGRKPIVPKCNPGDCCMQGENCTRGSGNSSEGR
ncbi:MAG: hypothetical protein QNI96_13655 [Woeseiaceae bacterium]|nr:hypothetical protein [Woeseiaceae bacterium]